MLKRFLGREKPNKQATASHVHRSVLDVPITEFTSNGLPSTINICERDVSPLVTLQQVKDHLHLLRAFNNHLFLVPPFTESATPTDSDASEELRKKCIAAAIAYRAWVRDTLSTRGGGQLIETEVPQLEVLMGWQAHLLNPRFYEKGLDGFYTPLRDVAFPLRLIGSRDWDTPLSSSSNAGDALELDEETVEIAEAIERQSKFIKNMNDISWLDQGRFDGDIRNLQIGIIRYHAWLDLMWSKECREFLVPTLNIDLAWHTHQLHHEVYKRDTELLLGTFLDHDDRAGTGKIGDGFERTGRLWKERFGYPY